MSTEVYIVDTDSENLRNTSQRRAAATKFRRQLFHMKPISIENDTSLADGDCSTASGSDDGDQSDDSEQRDDLVARDHRTLQRFSYDCAFLPALHKETHNDNGFKVSGQGNFQMKSYKYANSQTQKPVPLYGTPPSHNLYFLRRPQIGDTSNKINANADRRHVDLKLPALETKNQDTSSTKRHTRGRRLEKTILELSQFRSCVKIYHKTTARGGALQSYSPEYKDYFEDSPHSRSYASPSRIKNQEKDTGLPSNRKAVLSPACLHRLAVIKRKATEGELPYNSMSSRPIRKSEPHTDTSFEKSGYPFFPPYKNKFKQEAHINDRHAAPVHMTENELSDKRVAFSSKINMNQIHVYHQKLPKSILRSQNKENCAYATRKILNFDVKNSGYISNNSTDFIGRPDTPKHPYSKPQLARTRMGADGGSGEYFPCSSAFKVAMAEELHKSE